MLSRINILKSLLATVLFIGQISISTASQSDGLQLLKQENLVGEARMTYLFWDVYDAKLFAHDGQWRVDEPFILELNYLRSLKGKSIAERSIEKIRDQGFDNEVKLNEWLITLVKIFPDVDETSTIKGVVDEKRSTRFYLNDELIGTIEQPEFTTQFFNIWVGEKTSEPKLRKKLLGLS